MPNKIILSRLQDGRQFVAKFAGNVLEDLIVDHTDKSYPKLETIFWGQAQREIAGTGGQVILLPSQKKGLMRNSKSFPEGELIQVQVNSLPQDGKPISLRKRIVLKGKYLVLTEDKLGINIARGIKCKDTQFRLKSRVDEVLSRNPIPANFGLIVRTASQDSSKELINELNQFIKLISGLRQKPMNNKPCLIYEGPDLYMLAKRDWLNLQNEEVAELDAVDSSADYDEVMELIHQSIQPKKTLPSGANMFFDQTEAMVVVDVNTSGVIQKKGTLMASREAGKVLCRELRIRGLSGKIVVDFPSMNKQNKRVILECIKGSLYQDNVPTVIHGWTNMGNFEMERKRDRVLAMGRIGE